MIRKSQMLALAIAAGMLLAAAMLVWAVCVRPIADKSASIANLKATLARLETQRVRLGGLERWRKAAEDADALKSEFFEAGADAANVAKLQNLMRVTAAGSGLTIVSARPAQNAGPAGASASQVILQMAMTGRVEQLAAFLAALEAAKPIVFVSALDIVSTGEKDGGQPLNISITARGFVWQGPKE